MVGVGSLFSAKGRHDELMFRCWRAGGHPVLNADQRRNIQREASGCGRNGARGGGDGCLGFGRCDGRLVFRSVGGIAAGWHKRVVGWENNGCFRGGRAGK